MTTDVQGLVAERDDALARIHAQVPYYCKNCGSVV